MTPAELAEVQSRAALAQTATNGRWPTDPRRVVNLLRYSTASQEFVATARRDVLTLCAYVRELEELLERARATAAGLALEPSAYDIGDDT